MRLSSQSDLDQRLASRLQVWPCSLWKHKWRYQFNADQLGSGELLSLGHSEVITAAHQEILRTGADALVTNTFGANAFVMESYGAASKVSAANRESARLAVEVSSRVPPHEPQPLVVGSIGPTCELLSLHPEKYESARENLISAYLVQAQALWEEGIRIFHLERCQDPLNAYAALVALARLEDQTGSPVTKVMTAEVKQGGLMILGTSVEAFWTMVQPFQPRAFGIVGRLQDVENSLAALAELVDIPLIVMVDIFAVASPEGWLQSPRSVSVGLANLVSRYNVRIAGVGIESEPDFLLSLVEAFRQCEP